MKISILNFFYDLVAQCRSTKLVNRWNFSIGNFLHFILTSMYLCITVALYSNGRFGYFITIINNLNSNGRVLLLVETFVSWPTIHLWSVKIPIHMIAERTMFFGSSWYTYICNHDCKLPNLKLIGKQKRAERWISSRNQQFAIQKKKYSRKFLRFVFKLTNYT